MQASAHLTFDGHCEAAFRFYERVFGGTITTMLRFGDAPTVGVPPGWNTKIIHANLTIGATALMGADVLPEQYQRPQGFLVLLSVDEAAEAERIFHDLAEQGDVRMPI